ncbi:MAG: hypothetical protein ACP5I3_10545 [Thermoproteus sp.]
MEISRRAFLAAIPAALAITLLYVYENYREVLCLAGRCPPSTFNASAIPVLADDLSVAHFNGSEVVHKAADGEVLERVKVPNPRGNVYIKVVNGVLVVANQDGCVFKVLAPVQKEFRGLGFVDWRGYAAVFASCSLSSGTPVELAPLL